MEEASTVRLARLYTVCVFDPVMSLLVIKQSAYID